MIPHNYYEIVETPLFNGRKMIFNLLPIIINDIARLQASK